MARIWKWIGIITASISSPLLAQETQTASAQAGGLSWGEAALVLAIVFIVMGGLALFGLLGRR